MLTSFLRFRLFLFTQIIVGILGFTFLTPSLSATIELAEILVSDPNHKSFTIFFRGEIVPTDVRDFKKILKQADQQKGQKTKNAVESLQMYSEGGDVATAIELGKIIRNNKLKTIVTGECASACVFLQIAGVERSTLGDLEKPNAIGRMTRIGLHRPYFSNISGFFREDDLRRAINKEKDTIKNYLSEMDVSLELLNIMYSIPSGRFYWLSTEEAQRLGVIGTDAAWDEANIARQAFWHGLSSGEYRERSSQSHEYCRRTMGQSYIFTSCTQAYLDGLPIDLYEKRMDIYEKVHKEYEASGVQRSDKEIRDCRMSIMTGARKTCW